MKTFRSHGRGFSLSTLLLLFAAPTLSALSDGQVPRSDHVVIVLEENHAYNQIIGSSSTHSSHQGRPARVIQGCERPGLDREVQLQRFAACGPARPQTPARPLHLDVVWGYLLLLVGPFLEREADEGF